MASHTRAYGIRHTAYYGIRHTYGVAYGIRHTAYYVIRHTAYVIEAATTAATVHNAIASEY
jgi:hypothetical protein